MNENEIIIRPAAADDALFIADVVAMAIADEEALHAYCGKDYISVLAEVASLESSQYSYRNALIAEVGGRLAGAVVGYDGATLHALRSNTLAVVEKRTGRMPSVVDETGEGEFYLDSLAVLPEFRGFGIGRRLLDAFCGKVFAEGHECVGLLVDYGNPKAEKLYSSLGFERVDTKPFFGHSMWHLQRRR